MDYLCSDTDRKYVDSMPWKAIDWGQPNELPEETNGVINGMTGQYQIHVDDPDDTLIADAHNMREARRIVAKHNAKL